MLASKDERIRVALRLVTQQEAHQGRVRGLAGLRFLRILVEGPPVAMIWVLRNAR